jgi:perosamine synthetase
MNNISRINIYDPNINKYKENAIDAINSGWISNHGIYIEAACNKLKSVVNSSYCILMSNGTCSTHCLFIALKYKYPDIKKIYVPNNCYVAAWNAALMEFDYNQLDIMKMDIDTWNIDTSEKVLNNLDINSAVLIVHNLGNIINVNRLKKIRPDLIFIEDNCEGLFGKYDNIYSGMSNNSLCSSCSFYGNKIVTTGEGGAFFTQDKDIYNYINLIYSQGMSSQKYIHKVHAYNYRMTNIQAAFLLSQLNDIDNILETKYKIFEKYHILLMDLVKKNKIKLFKKEKNTVYAPWIFACQIINNKQDIIITTEYFNNNKIDIRPFFYPINSHHHLKNIKNDDNISYKLNQEVIMLPSSPTITYEEQEHIVKTINQYIIDDINFLEINENNKEYLKNFIEKITSSFFTYFDKRDLSCISNHKYTILLEINKTYIGYGHIDFDIESGKHWLGIYILDNYRGRGFSSLIMIKLLKFYKENLSQSILYLSVNKNNNIAIKLYKKYNFEIYEETDKNIFMIYIYNGCY